MKIQWRPEAVNISVTKHFAIKYMRVWGWDFYDLRDVICDTYKIERVGKNKFELYVQKAGFKKIVTVYFSEDDELLCITGSEGGKRI